jgi:hypothetical protein
MPKYPFVRRSITRRQAVEFIAPVVYPKLVLAGAKKRVRERIRYATKKGLVDRSDPVDAQRFFTWATGTWPELRKVEGLPYQSREILMSGTARMKISGLAHLSTAPSDPNEVRELYWKEEQRRMQLEEENRGLADRLAQCERECAEWRRKDRERRETGRATGKLGGRGRTR